MSGNGKARKWGLVLNENFSVFIFCLICLAMRLPLFMTGSSIYLVLLRGHDDLNEV